MQIASIPDAVLLFIHIQQNRLEDHRNIDETNTNFRELFGGSEA